MVFLGLSFLWGLLAGWGGGSLSISGQIVSEESECIATKRFLNIDVMTVQCVMDSVWVCECVHACACVCVCVHLCACMCVCNITNCLHKVFLNTRHVVYLYNFSRASSTR